MKRLAQARVGSRDYPLNIVEQKLSKGRRGLSVCALFRRLSRCRNAVDRVPVLRVQRGDQEALAACSRKGFVGKKRRSNMVLQARIGPNTFWLDTPRSDP